MQIFKNNKIMVFELNTSKFAKLSFFPSITFLPKAKKQKGWLGMMCLWDGIGRSMNFLSVRLCVTSIRDRCALQLARGHSNGEQVYLRMQSQATMYCCVLNRTDCAVSINRKIGTLKFMLICRQMLVICICKNLHVLIFEFSQKIVGTIT